jgi:hypothetical protein
MSDLQINTNESTQEITPTIDEVLYKKEDVQVEETKVEGESVEEKTEETEKVSTEGEIKLEHIEDYVLAKEDVDEIAAFAKEQGLSQEAATSLLSRENNLLSNFMDKQEKDHDSMVNGWAKEIESDKEFGGEKFKDNVNYAHQVIKKFGDDGFIKALNESGYGNHPGLFKVFAKIGAAMKDDNFEHGQSNTTPKELTMAERIYGKE